MTMKKLKHFEDLQCWTIAVELCELVYALCEKASLPSDDELACRWYVASMNISGKIAFAFWPEQTEWAVKYLPAVKKYCMETVFWAQIAYKKWLIKEKQLTKVITKTKRIIKKVDAILRYLTKYESQEKYKWKVLFSGWEE